MVQTARAGTAKSPVVMKSIAYYVLAGCLALVLGGGNPVVGDLRTTLKATTSSTPLPDEEEHRGKQVEVQAAAAATTRRVKPRVGAPRPVVITCCPQLPASARYEPICLPDCHSDLRNGIGAPLRC